MIYIIKKKTIYKLCLILTLILFFQMIGLDYIKASETNGGTELKTGLRYIIMVDCEIHTLYLFLDGKVVKKYPVACGKPKTPSPIGSWKIISKERWGEGFGGSWLGLNVPWGKYGIHGTKRPESIGRNASHGCIRMRNSDIAELYRIIPHGTKVLIVNGVFGVFGRGFRNLKPGDRGADVYAVQKRLNELGYDCGRPDGVYGENMKKAVFKYQKDSGLYVSNIINREMLEKMGFKEFE